MHDADRFLQALGKDRTTFQVFPDADVDARPRILHGPHKAHARKLQQLNEAGMGVFAMIADGDLRGRRAENVTRVAAYFADFDGTSLPDVWPLPPTMIVESSPGKYHAYWRIADAPPDKRLFAHIQAHLAVLFDSDDKVVDLPRVMRLPGYQHRKREPFTTRIVEVHDREYTHDQFVSYTHPPPLPKVTPPLPPEVRKYMNWGKPKRKGDPLESATQRVQQAGEGTRNDTLYRIACAVANNIREGETTLDHARRALSEAAESTGLPQHEINRTLDSALRHAQ